MNTKHTPGPWKTVIGPSTCAVTTSNDAPKQAGICRILDKSVAYIDGEAQANARLIAAAPDMLVLLIRVLDFEQRLTACKADGGDKLVSDIRAALAKAEGGA